MAGNMGRQSKGGGSDGCSSNDSWMVVVGAHGNHSAFQVSVCKRSHCCDSVAVPRKDLSLKDGETIKACEICRF